MTVITNVVIIAKGTKVSEKYSLSFKVLETFIYVYLITYPKIKIILLL